MAVLLVVVIGWGGCRASRSAKAPASEEATAQSPKRTAPARPAAPAPAPVAPPENPWFPPQDWSERREAEDFRIGVLQGVGGEEAAHQRLREVCEGLVKGTVAVSALDPERATGLSEMLTAQIQRGGRPTEYRIGRLERVSDVEMWARVRFAGEGGSAEGEAFLVRLPDGWFVSDLQVDLSMPQVRRTGSFVPSPYRGKTD